MKETGHDKVAALMHWKSDHKRSQASRRSELEIQEVGDRECND